MAVFHAYYIYCWQCVIDWFYRVVKSIQPTYCIFLKTIRALPIKRERLFEGAKERLRKSTKRVYAVLISRWHILGVSLQLWHRIDTESIMKWFVTLHNITTKDTDGIVSMGTKKIVSVNSIAEITQIGRPETPTDASEEAEMNRRSTDRVEEQLDQKILTDALANSIWEKFESNKIYYFTQNDGFAVWPTQKCGYSH